MTTAINEDTTIKNFSRMISRNFFPFPFSFIVNVLYYEGLASHKIISRKFQDVSFLLFCSVYVNHVC